MSKTYKFVILDENNTQHSFVTNESLKLYAMLMSKVADETILYKARTPQESMQYLKADIESHNVDFDCLKYGYVEVYQESDLSDSNYFSNFETYYDMLLEKSNVNKVASIITQTEEMYILQSCNEWQEHSSARIKIVSSDMEIIKATILRELINDNMEYGRDPNQSSIKQFVEDVLNDEFSDDYLKFGFIETHENVQVETLNTQDCVDNLSDSYSILNSDNPKELIEKHILSEVIKRLDLNNVGYSISNVEMESDSDYIHGFIPHLDSLEDFEKTKMYEFFMAKENKGDICITSNQIIIGNAENVQIPTEEQAILLFENHTLLEKTIPFEPVDGWCNDNYLKYYSDDLDDEFER